MLCWDIRRAEEFVMTPFRTAGLAAATLLVTTTLASAQLCAIPLMIAAGITWANEKRELTTKEAMTCGLIPDADASKAAKAKGKKMAKREKKPA
jgi:hypothetical protein